jgi:hypothetical protein
VVAVGRAALGPSSAVVADVMAVEWPERPEDDIVSALPVDEAERCVLACPSSLAELVRAGAVSSLYAGPAMPSWPSNVTPFPRPSVRTARLRAAAGSVQRPSIVCRQSGFTARVIGVACRRVACIHSAHS